NSEDEGLFSFDEAALTRCLHLPQLGHNLHAAAGTESRGTRVDYRNRLGGVLDSTRRFYTCLCAHRASHQFDVVDGGAASQKTSGCFHEIGTGGHADLAGSDFLLIGE